MISRGEIKKCGFKPVEDHQAEQKSYRRSIPGGYAELRHFDEETGGVCLSTHMDSSPNPEVGQVVFLGHLPARHELQIILRCTGIA